MKQLNKHQFLFPLPPSPRSSCSASLLSPGIGAPIAAPPLYVFNPLLDSPLLCSPLIFLPSCVTPDKVSISAC